MKKPRRSGAKVVMGMTPAGGLACLSRYCSVTCRQRAHRKAVTDKSTTPRSAMSSRDNGAWERGILALLERHPALFLNDLLPEERTRAQYQALSLAAVKLEAEDKITSVFFWARWGQPGKKVLLRRGYQIKKRLLAPRSSRSRMRARSSASITASALSRH
jgi:hypothetical protein